MKKLANPALTLSLGLFAIGCGEEGPTNPGGNSSPTSQIANPTGDLTVQLGTPVNFQGTASDPDGQVVSHTWDFDDGNTSPDEDPGNYTFPAEGVFNVTYQVTDNEGATSQPDQVVVTVQSSPPAQPSLGTEVVVSSLPRPTYLTAPAGDPRLFITQQNGQIRIVDNGQLLPSTFLDISGQVTGGNEQGLLSMVFHPDYANNGYFYINYTDNSGDTQVVRYTVSGGDPNQADGASAFTILSVAQEASNHNGGHLVFGEDGMLYIPLGDGGGSGDPNARAQDPTTLLGSILRIDVDGGSPYAIPSDNPFASGQGGARPEVWAYGVRNPWRIAFDRVDGVMYVADVGQNTIEEVNAVAASSSPVNYGWRTMEGTACFNPASGCTQTGLTLPVVEYDHGEGCSITGGFAYRGSAIQGLAGHYFYSDYCSGFVRSFRFAGGIVSQAREWNLGGVGNVLSYGEDSAGELYILSDNSTVYRLIQTN